MEGVGAVRAGDGSIVKNNSFRPTTNNRGYGHPLTKTPDRECACRARFASFNFRNAPISAWRQALAETFRVSSTNQSALTRAARIGLAQRSISYYLGVNAATSLGL
jgi:hypothetical protein